MPLPSRLHIHRKGNTLRDLNPNLEPPVGFRSVSSGSGSNPEKNHTGKWAIWGRFADRTRCSRRSPAVVGTEFGFVRALWLGFRYGTLIRSLDCPRPPCCLLGSIPQTCPNTSPGWGLIRGGQWLGRLIGTTPNLPMRLLVIYYFC